MKKSTTGLLAAAVTGLFLGSTTGCSSTDTPPTSAEKASAEKHACKGMNDCAGQGGCASGDNKCAGKNTCKGKGGCANVKHACRGQNDCKGQGGCKTSSNACAGQNACKGQGGCKVPRP
jgi:hypothetical protein